MSQPSVTNILVVGTSRLAQAVLAKKLGSSVGLPAAKSAEQALERLLLDLSIDAVVCDLALPGKSGELLLARLRRSGSERLRRLPFVALGGNEDPRRALAVITAGASAYVAKPRVSHDLVPTLAGLLPGRIADTIGPAGFDAAGVQTGCVGVGAAASLKPDMAADLNAAAPIGSVLRLRWDTRAEGNAASEMGGAAAIAQQIRFAFESHLRSRDVWRPDTDGHGGVLGLACAIEDSLRPVLRLAANLNDAAIRLQQNVAIAIRLEASQPAGTIDIDDPQHRADAPELPEAGEMTVALPGARFRLKLDAVGRG